MTEIHPFSNPDQVAKDLAEFKATDRNNSTLNDITVDYLRRFQTLPIYPIKVRAGTILFRTRRNFGNNSEPFKQLDLNFLLKLFRIKPGFNGTPEMFLAMVMEFQSKNNKEFVVYEVLQWGDVMQK